MSIRSLIAHLEEEDDESRRWRAYSPARSGEEAPSASSLPAPFPGPGVPKTIVAGRGRTPAPAEPAASRPEETGPIGPVLLRSSASRSSRARSGVGPAAGIAARFGVPRSDREVRTEPRPVTPPPSASRLRVERAPDLPIAPTPPDPAMA